MEVILNYTLTGMLQTLSFWFTLNKGTKDIDSGLSLLCTQSELLNLMPYSVLFQSAQCHFNQLKTA